jgi:hypothetical protein
MLKFMFIATILTILHFSLNMYSDKYYYLNLLECNSIAKTYYMNSDQHDLHFKCYINNILINHHPILLLSIMIILVFAI